MFPFIISCFEEYGKELVQDNIGGYYFFILVGISIVKKSPIMFVITLTFFLVYVVILIHVRMTSPKHIINLIKFAKDSIEFPPSVLQFYYDFNKIR